MNIFTNIAQEEICTRRCCISEEEVILIEPSDPKNPPIMYIQDIVHSNSEVALFSHPWV